MLDMSTTYVRPSLSIKSTPYRSIPNARPQRSAMSACSAVGANGSPYFSASVRAVEWLDDERSPVQQGRQEIGLRNDVRDGHRGPGGREHPGGDHLVAQRYGHGIRIHDRGALGVQGARHAHRDARDLLQHVEVVLHT